MQARGADRLVSVGVFTLFQPVTVEVQTKRDSVVSIQSGATETQRVLIEGQRLQVKRVGELLEVRFFEPDGRLLQMNQCERVHSRQNQHTLSIPGRMQRTFFGELEVVARGVHLLPRVLVPEETAVGQILRSEMAEPQEPEALKAQAILIRSYLRISSRHRNEGYDFCDTTHCQFFTAFREGRDGHQKAVLDTQDLVLTFLGKPFQPLYTAACGGHTLQKPSNGGYPYRAVVCNFCSSHPLFAWQTSVAIEKLLHALQENSHEDPARILGSLAEQADQSELSELKQKIRLRVGRSLGWNIIRSNRYTIETTQNSATIKGHGSGHNLGLCQAGAIEMSRQGKNVSEILDFYFPGCRITQ